MEESARENLLAQVEGLEREYRKMSKAKGSSAWSAYANVEAATSFVTSAKAVINRAAGPDSEYAEAVRGLFESFPGWRIGQAVPIAAGAVLALGNAIKSDYLLSYRELIHAEVFADFVEMAEHLLQQGYKDAAAVLIRGVLEGHLRKLCAKKNIPTEFKDKRGKSRPKKAEEMNVDLAKAGVYGTSEQKAVTSWYGLGTDAAHGHYERYEAGNVRPVLDGVRNFLVQYRA